jgi:putative integral membrane protein (TIGR02587 family)
MAQFSATQFFRGIGRGFGGAILFSLPLLMTMEMWQLGLYIEPGRLLALTLFGLPLLIALSHYSGFEETARWRDDVRDGIVAYAIGALASAGILLMLSIIGPDTNMGDIIVKVAVQATPAGLGAVLANSQLRAADPDKRQEAEQNRKDRASYAGELLFMLAGALFLAFNVAPTEEMVLISYRITAVHCIALVVVSLGLTHAFVYALDFQGQATAAPGTPWWSILLRFSVVSYAVSLIACAYILWTFGRFDGGAWPSIVQDTLVLAFPSSIGAAAARLVL